MLKTTVKILLYLAALAIWATFGAFATIGLRFGLSPLTPIVKALAINGLLLTWLAFPVTCGVAVFSGRVRGLVLFLRNLGLWLVFFMGVLVLDRNV